MSVLLQLVIKQVQLASYIWVPTSFLLLRNFQKEKNDMRTGVQNMVQVAGDINCPSLSHVAGASYAPVTSPHGQLAGVSRPHGLEQQHTAQHMAQTLETNGSGICDFQPQRSFVNVPGINPGGGHMGHQGIGIDLSSSPTFPAEIGHRGPGFILPEPISSVHRWPQ